MSSGAGSPKETPTTPPSATAPATSGVNELSHPAAGQAAASAGSAPASESLAPTMGAGPQRHNRVVRWSPDPTGALPRTPETRLTGSKRLREETGPNAPGSGRIGRARVCEHGPSNAVVRRTNRPRSRTMPHLTANPPPRFSSPPRPHVGSGGGGGSGCGSGSGSGAGVTGAAGAALASGLLGRRLRIDMTRIPTLGSMRRPRLGTVTSPSTGPLVSRRPRSGSSDAASDRVATSDAVAGFLSPEQQVPTPHRRRARSSSAPGQHSPRSATATLLRKAVLLYTRAVAAKAKKQGNPPPTAAEAKELIRITNKATIAVQLLRRALAIYTALFGDKDASVAAVYKVMGCIFVKCGDRNAWKMAMKAFRRALRLCEVAFGPRNPVTVDVLYNIALLHSKMGDHAAATEAFSKVLREYERTHGSDDPTTRFIRGRLDHSRGDDRKMRYTTLYSRGMTQLQEGRSDEALSAFTECLELMPKDEQGAYGICCCHCRAGRLDKALTWFQRAVEWGFHDTDLVATDTDIAPLRSLDAFWKLAQSHFGLSPPTDAEAAAASASAAAAAQAAAAQNTRSPIPATIPVPKAGHVVVTRPRAPGGSDGSAADLDTEMDMDVDVDMPGLAAMPAAAS